MHSDRIMPARNARSTPALRLRTALLELAENHAAITRHSEKNWASITFAGARHQVELLFEGAEAIAAGERFIDALPDHEFAIHGQLVADAAISEVDHRIGPDARMTVRVELLLLEEA